MKSVSSDFKYRGLHEKHVVAFVELRKKRVLASSCLSALSSWAPTGRIFMKFGI